MKAQIIIDRITELCKTNNISVNKMLEEANMSKSLIDNLKKGSMPSIDKIESVANYFDATIDYITGRTQIPYFYEQDDLFTNATSYTTDYQLYRKIYNPTINKYNKYVIIYTVTIGDKKIQQNCFVEPLESKEENYELIDAIFKEKMIHRIEIIKTNKQPVNSDPKTLIFPNEYFLRISEKDDFNNLISCTLKPNKYNFDKFQNFISILKGENIIQWKQTV